jgi:Transmembrane protein 131-like N-terminal
LIAKFEVITITNKQRKKDIEIKALIASSPELTFYMPEGVEFPIRLHPFDSIEIRVAFISENLGLFDALMYMVVDEWIYVSSFNAYVVPNVYDIYPFYVTDLNVNQSIDLPLYITNPSTQDTLIIEELYSTEE